MNSKIIDELKLFKDRLIKIQNIAQELEPITKTIESIVGDIQKYECTDEETEIVIDMETILKDITNTLNAYYN